MLFWEVISSIVALYFANQFYEDWSDDVDNEMLLGEKYRDIGLEYRDEILDLRSTDQPSYNYSNNLTIDPACENRAELAAITALLAGEEDHGSTLRSLPEWASGERFEINRSAMKVYLSTAPQLISSAENNEWAKEEQQHRFKLSAIAGTASGSAPSFGLAYAHVSNITVDAAEQSAGSLNSALGLFGKSVSSVYNRASNALRGSPTQEGVQLTGEDYRKIDAFRAQSPLAGRKSSSGTLIPIGR